MANTDIRQAAKNADVRLWQIADEMGIADCSLSRKLRKELPEAEKRQIMVIIDKLKGVM